MFLLNVKVGLELLYTAFMSKLRLTALVMQNQLLWLNRTDLYLCVWFGLNIILNY